MRRADSEPSASTSLGELAFLFLKLGTIAFEGSDSLDAPDKVFK